MHVHFWPGSTVALGGLRNKVQSAKLFATGKDVKFEQDDFRVRFTGLPEKAPDDPVTTIAIECDGEPHQDNRYVRKGTAANEGLNSASPFLVAQLRRVHRRTDAVVHQDGIALLDAAVGAAIDSQFAAANLHVGVTARHEAIGSLSVRIREALRRGNAGAVAIGHAHRMGANLRLHFA